MREGRLAQLAHDWSEDFALWDAVYPGLDWRKLTMSAFLARLEKMAFVLAQKNGTWTEKDELHRKAENDNSKIRLMLRLKSVFKNYEEVRG